MNGRTTLVAPGHLEVTITDSVEVEALEEWLAQ